MTDRAQIATTLRISYPRIVDIENGQEVELNPVAYEERIQQWTDAEVASEARRIARDEQVALRRQVRTALTALDADIERLGDGQAMAIAQLRPIVLRIARIERGLIQALIDQNLIERDG